MPSADGHALPVRRLALVVTVADEDHAPVETFLVPVRFPLRDGLGLFGLLDHLRREGEAEDDAESWDKIGHAFNPAQINQRPQEEERMKSTITAATAALRLRAVRDLRARRGARTMRCAWTRQQADLARAAEIVAAIKKDN